MKKVLAFVLAITLVLGSMGTAAFAETSVETVWNGDALSAQVTAGIDGYTFMSVYRKPGHAYEMSNHMVGSTPDIPQTLVLVDASKDYTWTPDGKYSFGQSNYEVLYCCDAETGYKDGIYYKRLNLEDSNYYDEEEAAHIRSIVSNSYPYVSLEEMKTNLAAEGFEDAEKLTRADIIAAVQVAIWGYANDVGDFPYRQTFDVTSNSQWGTVMHDYTNEMDVFWGTGRKGIVINNEVGARIDALAAHLKAQAATYPEKHQIIISDLEITDAAPVQEKDGVYKTALHVELNNSGSSDQDEINLTIYVDDTAVTSVPVELGTENYDFIVEAANEQTIKAVVSGTQVLPQGAYFYEPQGGRDISQCLVGVAGGNTDVYASAEETLKIEVPVYANLTLQKTNELGEALSGAEFTLSVITDAAKIFYDTYAVDENGRLVIEKLLPGSYELEETTVPEGYVAPEEAITFTVDENGALTIAESNYASLGEDGVITVVNEVPTFSISGSKTWNDEDNKDGIRPESIIINLLADGVVVDTKTVTEADGWSWTFDGLDKYADGKEIVYTISEEAVEGYTTTVEGYNVTNTHIPEEDKELPPGDPVIDEPEDDPEQELPPDENVIDEPEDDPVVEEEEPEQELPEDENVIDEPEDDPVVEEEEPKQELPEDENIIDEPAPDTGDHDPVMMLLLTAFIALAGAVTLSFKRK